MGMIEVTEQAVLQIKDMIKTNEEESVYLRFSVHGGGCSGLSYGLGLDHETKEGDCILEVDGLTILVDKETAPIVEGTKIDYKLSLMGGGFTIDNPNAIATCGCGSSFRTKKDVGKPESC